MIIHWIVLFIFACLIASSYIKHYPLKTRVLSIVIFYIVSLLLVLPVVPFSIIKLTALFLLEKLWILLSIVLFIEVLINKKNRVLLIVSGVISIIIYFFLRTAI